MCDCAYFLQLQIGVNWDQCFDPIDDDEFVLPSLKHACKEHRLLNISMPRMSP